VDLVGEFGADEGFKYGPNNFNEASWMDNEQSFQILLV
jgi:hypothetical protein